jgi:hypothetical protein
MKKASGTTSKGRSYQPGGNKLSPSPTKPVATKSHGTAMRALRGGSSGKAPAKRR